MNGHLEGGPQPGFSHCSNEKHIQVPVALGGFVVVESPKRLRRRRVFLPGLPGWVGTPKDHPVVISDGKLGL